MGTITNPADLAKMRAACQDAAKVLDFITPYVKPGVTTGELDRLCLEYLTDVLKVKSATVGYAPPGYPPFTGAICAEARRFAEHRRHHHQGRLVWRHEPHVRRGRAIHPVAPPDRHHF
ncbi:hypothetical protein G6F56_014109 [Rhizopus delemar]|nr:hypothetical protein G6F56_014109 [Rhizopus delemar]